MDRDGFATSRWLRVFEKYTFATVALCPPAAFYNFLVSDGISAGGTMPKSLLSDNDSDDSAENTGPECIFPEFHAQVSDAINQLGGAVIPRIGLSTPKDAIWITVDHSCRCRTPAEVYQLLKASDRVAVELGLNKHAEMVLKKFDSTLNPQSEFRVFVRSNRVVAVSQRDDTVYYPTLEQGIDKIFAIIHEFVKNAIVAKSYWSVPFVVDLYVQHHWKETKIVDFGPWNARDTSAILFTWDEIDHLHDSGKFEFRRITCESECRIGHARLNSAPVDWNMILSAETGDLE
mgnify:CR=1 FL=1